MSEHTHILDLSACKPKDLPEFMEEGDPVEVLLNAIGISYEIVEGSLDKSVYKRWEEGVIARIAKEEGAPKSLIRKLWFDEFICVNEHSIPPGARIVPVDLWDKWKQESKEPI